MTLPNATTRLSVQSGGLVTGSDLLVVWAPVPDLADNTPRYYSSSADILTAHGYSQGLDYCALHFQETNKPVLFIPLPIDTAGTVGRFDSSGNTGTSVVTCAVGSDGSLEETDGILKVATNGGGTIGTSQIVLSLSCDGGRTYKPVKLGTASSYTIPNVGLVLSFAAGTLVAGDTVLTWHSTAPLAGSSDIAAAKILLANQTKLARRWFYLGDNSVSGDLTAIQSAVGTYETSNERYTLVKCSLRDRLPQAEMSTNTVSMTTANVTFAEVGATGDTITRASGSFITDGFLAGDRITVTGSSSNNITDEKITNVSALVLTLDTGDLAAEGPVAGVSITGKTEVQFDEVGATGDTITLGNARNSWLADGFRSGDILTIAGTASNNGTTAVIDTVTATVITLTSFDLTDEDIGQDLITITAGETDAQAIANLDSAMSTISGDERMDLGYGRGSMLSPVTGWKFRRNVNWADNIAAYQRDMRTTTWWKDLGPLSGRIGAGFNLNDSTDQPYEHDERNTQGAIAAGFTCARTWGNGPAGAFIAKSLTRATTGTILTLTHNADVANLVQTIVQTTTENFAGQTLVLEPADENGKRVATTASLAKFESKVNKELARYVLSNIGGEGPRASVANWVAATDDDLGVADATLNGTCTLELNGTITQIATTVVVS